ncbi:hypothetical protein GCM10025863_22710 [Microbacterium suwonense]|uniref:Secreted protein n=1 Tax=Microbacterium suwonense TaxID=683047 RepID=A0ABM8FVL5_9MICO|nr:hypothetical protein [Microbacterium suwonense]BDZ39657.1 hypothetical protein GCM10025863_22710 [Microbacterium suwonense]
MHDIHVLLVLLDRFRAVPVAAAGTLLAVLPRGTIVTDRTLGTLIARALAAVETRTVGAVETRTVGAVETRTVGACTPVIPIRTRTVARSGTVVPRTLIPVVPALAAGIAIPARTLLALRTVVATRALLPTRAIVAAGERTAVVPVETRTVVAR